jgi:hypothetical protein
MVLTSWLGSRAARRRPVTVQLSVEPLDERLLPSHVRLPLPPSDPPGIQVAAEANPHFGGFKTITVNSGVTNR